MSLLSRIEDVYAVSSDAHESYQKLWKDNDGKIFLEKAIELLRDYGRNYFLRFRWNLTHRQEVNLFIEKCQSHETPENFLRRLLKSQDTKNPYGSLSRRLHFIIMKGMEEAGLFPGVYKCKMTALEELELSVRVH